MAMQTRETFHLTRGIAGGIVYDKERREMPICCMALYGSRGWVQNGGRMKRGMMKKQLMPMGGSRFGRDIHGPRVCALFGRGSRKKKQDLNTPEERDIEREVVEETGSKSESWKESEVVKQPSMHQQIPADPPLWRQLLHDRTMGPVTVGSFLVGLTLYCLHFLLKDRSEMIDQVEFDLSCLMGHLQRLKELRMDPEMSDSDVLRVRTFLVSQILEEKSSNPVKALNQALDTLDERHINKIEAQALFGTDNVLKPQIQEEPKKEVSEEPDVHVMSSSLSMMDATETSAAFEPDATVLWWQKLPYICVLQMKKSRALFMTAASGKGPDAFALLGFEDPEEAFQAGKMPVEQQLWGVLSQIRSAGAMPMPPSKDEKHFDLTWVHPFEFNALMESTGCYGVVVPAGTLRSPQTGRPIPPLVIKSAIDEICNNKKIGVTKAVATTTRFPESEVRQDASPNEKEHAVAVPMEQSVGVNNVNGFMDELDLTSDLLNGSPSQQERKPDAESSPESNTVYGNASRELSNGKRINGEALGSPSINGASLNGGSVSEADIQTEFPPSSSSPDPIAQSKEPQATGESQETGAASESTAEPWWLELDTIVLPKIKTVDSPGGNVEINISFTPEVADFRPILFEDPREAKGFLGILGKLHGPDTLVATEIQSPRDFIDQHPEFKKDKIVVLCTGALLLNRDADRDGLRYAVRLAHLATEKKKGVISTDSDAFASLDDKSKRVAEDLIAKFKDRVDNNMSTQSQKGDADYQDPIEGFLNDLEVQGLDDIFPDLQDGISAEVGGKQQDAPFHGPSSQPDGQENSFYDRFVAQMSQNISKTQESILKHDTTPSTSSSTFPSANSGSEELDISLDDLIGEEEKREEELGEDEGFTVVYPDSVQSGKPHKKGPKWFMDEDVIYMPQYLTSRGQSTFLAMEDPHSGRRLVVGFQDRRDATACKEMMKTWPDTEHVAATVTTVQPQALIGFCQDANVEPVVIRKSALSVSMDMSRSTFMTHVGLIAGAQVSDFPIF